MECRSVHDSLERGQPLSAEAQEHLLECPACRALAADGGELARLLGAAPAPAPAFDVDAMLRGMEGTLESPPRHRLRELPTRTRVAAAAALVLAVLLAMAVAFPRPDLAIYPTLRLLAELTLQTGAALAAAWIVLRPLHLPALSDARRVGAVAVALLAPVALAALPAAHGDHAASLAGAGDDFARRALACFAYGAAWTAPLLLLLRLSDRMPGRASTLAAAGAAGLVASAALLLHCPITHPEHLLAGHATVGLAWAALALLRRPAS